jgi:hypothetical protein
MAVVCLFGYHDLWSGCGWKRHAPVRRVSWPIESGVGVTRPIDIGAFPKRGGVAVSTKAIFLLPAYENGILSTGKTYELSTVTIGHWRNGMMEEEW